MMKVCLITGAFPPQRCGIGDYTECLGRHLASLNVDVHVVTSVHQSGDRHDALELHRVVRRWNSIGSGRLFATLSKIKPDVVHVQFPSVGYRRTAFFSLVPAILRALNYKVVLTLHEYKIAQWPDRFRQLAMATAASQLISTNLEDRASLCRRLFWKRSRVHRIGIASNIEVHPAAYHRRGTRRRQIGADDDSPVICFFGNLHPGKGLDELIAAFAIVSRKIPGSRLLIIGTFDLADTLYSCALRRKIAEADLRQKVHTTGFITRPQVSEFLLASDICVLPFRDGLSVRRGSFLAAVHHGLPVITTAPQTPLPDSIVDGRNVVLVPPGNVHRLAESMQTLMQSPDLLNRLKRNLSALDRCFSWPEIARRTVEVYENA